MKLAWLTDVHLNFLEAKARHTFYDVIVTSGCDAVLMSGDIAEAPSLAGILKEMVLYLNQPIYFVLGNHDYYYSQVDTVREQIIALTQSEKLLFWLPASGPQVLDNDVVLLGVDGWADGRYGDYANTQVVLPDSLMIGDLFQQKTIGKDALLAKMQQLADSDACQLHDALQQVFIENDPKKIIVLTHVPPFKEACLHKGERSSDDWLPYFASKATGNVLTNAVISHPAIEFTVLSGHTHTQTKYKPLDNLIVKVGQAKTGMPQVQEVVVL